MVLRQIGKVIVEESLPHAAYKTNTAHLENLRRILNHLFAACTQYTKLYESYLETPQCLADERLPEESERNYD